MANEKIITPQQLHFEKTKMALRYQLMGRASRDSSWYVTVKALDLGLKYHVGFRKDKVTPEFQHQIEIALYLLTLEKLLLDAPRTIADALLHDLGEDYGAVITFQEIAEVTDQIIADDCADLAKVYRDTKKTPEEYFSALADNPRASIVKGADRNHNLRTMAGVFNLEKQTKYCDETEEHFYGFLKLARRSFPEQEPVYENIKFMMTTQVRIYRSVLAQGIAA